MTVQADAVNGDVKSLSEVTLEGAVSLERALWEVDQRRLLNLVGRKRKYPRRSLRAVVDCALEQEAIRGVKARLFDGTVETFVNLGTFPAEFSLFLEMIAEGRTGLSVSELRRRLSLASRKERSSTRRILRSLCSSPTLLRAVESFCPDLGAFVKLALTSRYRPNQNYSEILGLLELLALQPPRRLLEIGTSKGGSLYLFTKVADSEAALVTVDLRIKNRKLLKSFERKGQHITLIDADSTSVTTIAQIHSLFPEGVDFLFLDGDHSYEGIRKDFVNYSPLVRANGKIAFHDICTDNASRYGISTGGWSGGVPRFWQEVKAGYEHCEFIDHPEQDGRGIGVLFLPEGGP